VSSGAVSGGGAGPAPAPAEWNWNRVLTPPVVLRLAVVVGLFLWAYWAYVNPFNGRWPAIWRSNDAWSHGFLIPVMAVLIAHYRLKEHNPQRIEPCLWGLVLILVGGLVRVWSRILMMGFPGEVTFVLVAAGIVLWVLGWQAFKALWIAVAYLVLMIPWDQKYYENLALPLQRGAAAATEFFLTLIGYYNVPHAELASFAQTNANGLIAKYWICRDANSMTLASGPINVAEACSGLRLLVAFLALGVFMAYLYRRPLWERGVIILTSLPIAVFCNFIRVTLMAIASDQIFFEGQAAAAGHPTWSTWFPRLVDGFGFGYGSQAQLERFRAVVLDPTSTLHQSFGFAMLGLAFLLLYLELGLIDRLFIEEEGPAEDKPAAPKAALRRWNA
jgi:exosortase/archaeosortase family protein